MSSLVRSSGALRSRMQTLLFERMLPKPIAGMLVAGGLPAVFWGLLAGRSLPAGGASQLVLVFSGSVLGVWGISELLPQRYRRSIALLRMYAIGGAGVAVFAFLMLFVFWWGMQQPP